MAKNNHNVIHELYNINVSQLEEVKQFLKDQKVAKAFVNTKNEKFPWNKRVLAGKQGLIGVDAPLDLGGKEFNHTTMGAIQLELGKISVNAREMVGIGHGALISKFGNNDQKQKYLKPVIDGKTLVGVGLTELKGGSNVNGFDTLAKPTKDGYLLSGEKALISRVQEAETFIVFARIKDKPKITAFIVSMNQKGIEKFLYTPMGVKGWSYGGFRLKDVFVPYEDVLGGEGKGFSIFNTHFQSWRTYMGLICIGSAYQALENTINYSKKRTVFNRSLASLKMVEFGELYTKLEIACSMCFQSLYLLDNQQDATKETAIAKLYATTVAFDVINQSMQIMGARGFISEYGLEQRLRDVRGFTNADGSTEVLKSLVGREIIGKSFYDEFLGRK